MANIARMTILSRSIQFISLLLISGSVLLAHPLAAYAQSDSTPGSHTAAQSRLTSRQSEQKQNTTYVRAKIIEVQKQSGSADKATIILLSGPEKGKTLQASIGALTTSLDVTPPHYNKGDAVLVSRETFGSPTPVFVVVDHYRLHFAVGLLVIILIIAVIFAGLRGIGAILGLILSVVVIAEFMIPQILHGNNPYLATATGVMIISGIGIFVAHGVSRRTSLALASTYITLLFAVGLSSLTVAGLRLSGISSEDIYLLSNIMPGLNIQGLLLCGTIISLIGVLDDITVGQATAVEELHRANLKLGTAELYKRGLRIGREHIASLINTLVLVYVGTSFLFIVYLSALSPFPLLVNLNSELIMEEIARSLVGSAALILAVPLTTILAARFLRSQNDAQEHVDAVASEPSLHPR